MLKQEIPSVYLDYAASTPIAPEVQQAMLPFLTEKFGNAGSVHSFGQSAVAVVDDARERASQLLGCQPSEIIFTSGATESNNLAIQGLVRPGDHVVTTAIEHPSVLEVCRQLEQRGVAVTYVPASRDGVVDAAAVMSGVTERTRLVSVMYVNNEIGTVQPIAQIGLALRELNSQRSQPAFFHCDAVQAAAYLPVDVDQLGVDLLTISGHKLHGPKGVGLLYRRTGVPLAPISFGGHQEWGLRPGTHNVAAIAGFGRALALLLEPSWPAEVLRIQRLRRGLIDGVLAAVPGSSVVSASAASSPPIAYFMFPGVAADTLVVALDQRGVAVASGAACATGAPGPSHVLQAMGYGDQAGLRVSIGRYTTNQEISRFLQLLPELLQQLRQ